MSDYPNSVFSPRELKNKAGVEFDAEKHSVLFYEDLLAIFSEIQAIESELGLLLKGAHDSAADRFADVEGGLSSHAGSSSNPHSVTKSQVGLGNVDDAQQATQSDFLDHKARHEAGGADTLDLSGLVGKGYMIFVQCLTHSPTDSVNRYFGSLPKAPVTTAATSKVYIRKAGSIKFAEIYSYSGTAGTNEDWSLYIRLNNSSETLIATVSAAASERIFSNTALNIPVVAGDFIEIKMVNPGWVTNPATSIFAGHIYVE